MLNLYIEQDTMDKLYVVDLMNLLTRHYYGGPSQPIRLKNITNTIIDLLDRKPRYLVVADESNSSFRKKLSKTYKANRPERNDELVELKKQFDAVLTALNIRTVSLPGLEADDVIGSIVKSDMARALDTYIISQDKDFMQLVSDNTRLMKSRPVHQYEILGPNEVKEKLGCPPDLVVDAMALAGDRSDGIAGLPGVGMATAAKLVTKLGDIKNIYRNIHSDVIAPKLREKLIKHQQSVVLDYKLVKIITTASLPISIKDIEVDYNYLKSRDAAIKLQALGLMEAAAKLVTGLRGIYN